MLIGVAAADPAEACAPDGRRRRPRAQSRVRPRCATAGSRASSATRRARPCDGVSVLAIGHDARGGAKRRPRPVHAALPPGEYLLRATREGYVSTYREPVRVQSQRAARARDHAHAGRRRRGQSCREPRRLSPSPAPQPVRAGRSARRHGEAAWRLRHLTRIGPARRRASDGADGSRRRRPASSRRGLASSTGPSSSGSARAARRSSPTRISPARSTSSRRASCAAARGWTAGRLAARHRVRRRRRAGRRHRRLAHARRHPAGDASSWTLLGEYQARADAAHAFRLGVSYSAQGYDAPDVEPAGRRRRRSRGASAAFTAIDRWRVGRALALDYGLRLDRYDYCRVTESRQPATSACALGVLPRTFVARRSVAADDRARRGRVPAAVGVRALAAARAHVLVARAATRRCVPNACGTTRSALEQRVRRRGAAIDVSGGSGSRPTNQVATLFGLDARQRRRPLLRRDAGQRRARRLGVARRRRGSRARARPRRVLGRQRAEWTRDRQSWALRRVGAVGGPAGRERLHDVTAALDADCARDVHARHARLPLQPTSTRQRGCGARRSPTAGFDSSSTRRCRTGPPRRPARRSSRRSARRATLLYDELRRSRDSVLMTRLARPCQARRRPARRAGDSRVTVSDS